MKFDLRLVGEYIFCERLQNRIFIFTQIIEYKRDLVHDIILQRPHILVNEGFSITPTYPVS